MNKEIGCTECAYAGHIELKECPEAYTEMSQYCGLYKHEPIEKRRRQSMLRFKTDKDHIKLYNDGNNTILIIPNERLYQATNSKKNFDAFLQMIVNIYTGFWFKRHRG